MIDMTRNEIDELLLGALVGRLCMVDPERKPYAIPMPFCWADGSVYLRVPLTGRKGAALAFSNLVCFEVDTYTQRLDYYASVLVEGRLVEVTDPLERARVGEINAEKYTRLRDGHRPGHRRQTAPVQVPIRRIEVTQISGRRVASGCDSIATDKMCRENNLGPVELLKGSV
jgi:nitroimidazol reductase NimA-like FMN-containing flavoprotein (pyridoxamine 5'-phosphate oxidase superfamily)